MDTRDYLARAFEHKTMKDASTRAENAAYHLADYSNATKWDRIKASAKVDQSKTAFSDWKSIRNEYVAHRYLVSLLSNYKEG